MPSVEKLPKWAQELIERKDREIKNLESQNEFLRNELAPEDTRMTLGASLDEIKLPEGVVSFRFERTEYQVMIRDGNGYHPSVLDIYCHPGQLYVMPSSGNAIHLISDRALRSHNVSLSR